MKVDVRFFALGIHYPFSGSVVGIQSVQSIY
jgi:hypothetical protein